MIGRNREQACIFKRRSHLFRIAAFHGRLHQVPVRPIALQKENSGSVGHDATPFVNAATVRNTGGALNAGSRNRVNNEKKQPRSEQNGNRKQHGVEPTLRALGSLAIPIGFGRAFPSKLRVHLQPQLNRAAFLVKRGVASRGRARWSRNYMHRRQETITLARHGLDKAGVLRVVLKRGAQLLQRGIKASFKVDVRTLRPEGLAGLLPFDDFAIPLEEHGKNAKGLFLNLDPDPLAAQGRASQINLEQAKSDDYGRVDTGIEVQATKPTVSLGYTISRVGLSSQKWFM